MEVWHVFFLLLVLYLVTPLFWITYGLLSLHSRVKMIADEESLEKALDRAEEVLEGAAEEVEDTRGDEGFSCFLVRWLLWPFHLQAWREAFLLSTTLYDDLIDGGE